MVTNKFQSLFKIGFKRFYKEGFLNMATHRRTFFYLGEYKNVLRAEPDELSFIGI